jgi:tRNA A-37 threonylcarbamoyl transferase component Bud32
MLFSRRNKVYKVKIKETGTLAIMKIYSKQRELLNEYANLEKVSNAGLRVPKVFIKIENILILEYIPGNLVNDLAEKQDLGRWIEELAKWITDLHQIKCKGMSLLKSDSNLRNFIFSDMKIYGLDFEEMRYGDPREDLGDICFFLLTNFPSFTNHKKIMLKRFLGSYAKYGNIKLDNMEYYISKSAEEAMKRRSRYLKS